MNVNALVPDKDKGGFKNHLEVIQKDLSTILKWKIIEKTKTEISTNMDRAGDTHTQGTFVVAYK